MAYIGKSPAVGNFVKLDAISTSSTNTYNLTLDSVAFVPESANHMLVSLNGVIQAPLSSFSVSGSTITFLPSSGTLSSSDSIDFIMVYGNVLDIGTPSDSTVTNAKTNFVSTSSSAGLQIKGDNTTGGTLQLNCEQNSHGIKLRSPAHSAGQSYTLTFPTGNVTADKFLKVASVSGSGATGIGQLSFAEAGGGSWVLLNTQTVSSGTVSSVESGAVFSSTYDTYVIVIRRINFSDNGGFYMYLGTSGGYTTSGYRYNGSGVGGAGNSLVTGSASADEINLVGGTGSSYHMNTSQDCLSGVIWIHNPYNSVRTSIHGELAWENATDLDAHINNIGAHPNTNTSYDRWKLAPSTGNFEATTIVQTFGVVNA